MMDKGNVYEIVMKTTSGTISEMHYISTIKKWQVDFRDGRTLFVDEQGNVSKKLN